VKEWDPNLKKKQIKGLIILDWRVKLKKKTNFIKELNKKPPKRMMTKSKTIKKFD
jgi:hypothetical protein